MRVNNSTTFTRNFNGEAIKPNEVMVPFEYTELEAEKVVNPECIRTIETAGQYFKVIYKAVPQEWAKRAKSAFNLVQNEALGHYSISNSVSMDMLEDEYGMALASAPSAEDLLMEQEDTNETVATFVELVSSVIEKSPKIGYAVLLLHTGVKGEEFYGKMRLTHGPANRVRQEAESILKDGLADFDVNSITGYKNQFNDVYKEEAYALLNAIVEMFK